jgi:hypothetical protein
VQKVKHFGFGKRLSGDNSLVSGEEEKEIGNLLKTCARSRPWNARDRARTPPLRLGLAKLALDKPSLRGGGGRSYAVTSGSNRRCLQKVSNFVLPVKLHKKKCHEKSRFPKPEK